MENSDKQRQNLAKKIAFISMKDMAVTGMRISRYIYQKHYRNELIDIIVERHKLDVDLDEDLREEIYKALDSAYRELIKIRNVC